MDLIYTDAYRNEIGVINSYILDLAYGEDENDFQLTIPADDHCCSPQSLIYIDGEEYGGIIDAIGINEGSTLVTYKGRTWHGILETHVICPPAGQDYRVFDGEANTILQTIIDSIGLTDLFVASTADSAVQINAYQVPRYVYAYSGICRMLKASGAKLHMEWDGTRCQLSAKKVVDYSQNEEFDASQVRFGAERTYRCINHILALGQGDLKDRAVIHVFADENGGIRPYARTDTPLQDSDYILDTSQQVLFGADDIMEILDYTGAEITTNYIRLTSRPSDWLTNSPAYYVQDGDGFKSVEPIEVGYDLQKIRPYDWAVNCSAYYTRSGDDYAPVAAGVTYTATTVKPSDWAASYAEYYTRSGSSYTPVEGVTTDNYIIQRREPDDWQKNYAAYYYLDDSTYRHVEGVTYYVYVLQTKKPSDWGSKFSSYYRKATPAELIERPSTDYYPVSLTPQKTVPDWQALRYYTRQQAVKAPEWGAGERLIYQMIVQAPTWRSGIYYRKDDDSAPTWAANTYYTKVDRQAARTWSPNTYFKAVRDRYAVLVASAVTRLEEAQQTDQMSVDLSATDQVYDIGDLVGGIESTLGITVVQAISKKIVRINNNDITISYEVT